MENLFFLRNERFIKYSVRENFGYLLHQLIVMDRWGLQWNIYGYSKVRMLLQAEFCNQPQICFRYFLPYYHRSYGIKQKSA